MLWLDGAQQGEIVLFLFHILLQIFVNKDSHLLFFYDTVYSGFFSAGKVTTLNRKHPKKLSRPPPTHTHTRFHILKKPFTWETMAEQDVIAYPAGKKKKHGLFFMFYKFLTL